MKKICSQCGDYTYTTRGEYCEKIKCREKIGKLVINCKGCGEDFRTFPSRKREYCKKECKERDNSTVYKKFGGKNKTLKINKEGFYLKNIQRYKDQLLFYKSAPTGKIYIGVAKAPLMKNEVFDYGYQGVLVQDSARQFIMCNGCGAWFKKITDPHLKKCVKMKMEDYKNASGYLKGTGLVSDETSLNLTRNIIQMKENYKALNNKRRKMEITGKITREKGVDYRGEKREWQNRYGTCPEQLKARMKEFILNNREFPGRSNKGQSLYKALRKRFGSLKDACKEYGLPYYTRQGTNYKFTFPDYTVYKFNINRNDQRKQLFTKMIEKCEFLKN